MRASRIVASAVVLLADCGERDAVAVPKFEYDAAGPGEYLSIATQP